MESGWTILWDQLDRMEALALALRRLSQQEPLLQARPDYPRARIGRSHVAELREVLQGIAAGLEAVERYLPEAFGEEHAYLGVAADESRQPLLEKVRALRRLAGDLADLAFQPPPPLPAHAPIYLYSVPGHDRSSAKALTLAAGLEAVVTALRNLVLAAANAQDASPG